MSEQRTLSFYADGSTIERNPLCIYVPHCGRSARIGPPEIRPGCINHTITCLKCSATGTRSINTEARAPRARKGRRS